MTIATLSPAENESKQQILAQLQQVLAQKTFHTFGKSADEAVSYPPPGLEAPRSSCLPDGIAPPPGLAPPVGLACPDRSKVGECRKKGVSGTDDYIDSDAEDTSLGAGSVTGGVSEGTDSEAENFQMRADALCFVPSFLSIAPCKVPSPHNESEAENFQMNAHAPCYVPSFVSTASSEESATNRKKRTNVTIMGEHVNLLQLEDPQRVVLARHVSKLGLDSSTVLKKHFGKYGEVKDVHVSRRENNTRGVYTRPSNLAFVVMVSSEGALKILRQAEHEVVAPDGVVHKILAEAFQQNPSGVLQKRVHEENHAKQSGGPAQKQ